MIKVDCVNRAANSFLKNKVSASNLELPAKIALGSLTALAADTFVMKCSDYDSSDCNSDYWCGLTFP